MKIKKLSALIFACLLLFSGCAKKNAAGANDSEEGPKQEKALENEAENEKTPEELKTAYLNNRIESMSLEEMVGQLFMPAFRQDENGSNLLEINETMKEAISKYKLGGVILFGENIDTRDQTQSLIASLQQAGGGELFIGVDEEGGRVSRLHQSGKIDAYDVPSAQEMAAGGDEKEAFSMYQEIGSELTTLGFNVDFAPVADINTNPGNIVIGDRAFGSDPAIAGSFVAEAVRGLHEEGIASCLKHFPGHGDTATDSHKGETVVEHTIERLESTELVPFKMGIEAGTDFIMAGHIKAPEITEDGLPASMSPGMIDGLLRGHLGYEGIVITDAMNMGAISQYYDSGEAARKAVEAGVDIILMPENLDEAYNTILECVANGSISEERLEKSVRRILSVKYDRGILNRDK